MSGVLNTLERRELIERRIDPTDRRRVMTAITSDGLAAIERVLPELHRAEVEWTAGLSPAQQQALLALLGRAQRHLKGVDGQG
jgi:DNA-binding MarR family transcriptional regulator